MLSHSRCCQHLETIRVCSVFSCALRCKYQHHHVSFEVFSSPLCCVCACDTAPTSLFVYIYIYLSLSLPRPLSRSHTLSLVLTITAACLFSSIFSPGFFDTATGMDELVDMMCVCQLTMFSDLVVPKLGKDLRCVLAVLARAASTPCRSAQLITRKCVFNPCIHPLVLLIIFKHVFQYLLSFLSSMSSPSPLVSAR